MCPLRDAICLSKWSKVFTPYYYYLKVKFMFLLKTHWNWYQVHNLAPIRSKKISANEAHLIWDKGCKNMQAKQKFMYQEIVHTWNFSQKQEDLIRNLCYFRVRDIKLIFQNYDCGMELLT